MKTEPTDFAAKASNSSIQLSIPPFCGSARGIGLLKPLNGRFAASFLASGLSVGAEIGLPLISLANETANRADVALTGISNEIDAPVGDGWARIAYGEWPHEQGLQRFGKSEADEMVGYFKNTWNRIKRAVVGMPIFRGHPDLVDQLQKSLANTLDVPTRANIESRIADLQARYPDRSNYGTIADMEAREDGLYLKPVLAGTGAALVNEGLKFFSPHWLARKLPSEGGRPVFSPVFMLSIGLTDRPNIAGTSLVNAKPESTNPMPKWLIELLGLANEASEETARAAIAALKLRPEATALANEQTARTTAEGQVTSLTAKVTEAETALANERTALAAARTAHAETLVAGAIREGRITEAAKPVWLGRLARDFATESTALANETVIVKVTAKTKDLGNRKATNTASEQFVALVNERTAKGESWDAAWHAVKATEQGKVLYDQMNTAAS